jgi:hypothetical protein
MIASIGETGYFAKHAYSQKEVDVTTVQRLYEISSCTFFIFAFFLNAVLDSTADCTLRYPIALYCRQRCYRVPHRIDDESPRYWIAPPMPDPPTCSDKELLQTQVLLERWGIN